MIMFEKVSWGEYFTGVSILLLVYYLLLWLIVFKASPSVLYKFIRFRRSTNVQDSSKSAQPITLDYLKEVLRKIFVGRKNKAELVMAIKNKLNPYYHLIGPELGEELNQFIAEESIRVCSIRLEDVDFKVIWE
jgi:hypothetical protein